MNDLFLLSISLVVTRFCEMFFNQSKPIKLLRIVVLIVLGYVIYSNRSYVIELVKDFINLLYKYKIINPDFEL
ncbi:MAG: hypothetical protein BWY74_00024 [Firmicutes bacterium ADurb.Bin419]|nr:MAG: hypothetical protein BWY74_00024 [Firmicutes bacterium ADurb.Bin419]